MTASGWGVQSLLTSQPCARELGPLECPMRFLLASLQPPRGSIFHKFGSTVFDLRILVSAQLSVPQSFYLQNGHSDPLNCFPFELSEGTERMIGPLFWRTHKCNPGVHLCPGPAPSKLKLKPKQDSNPLKPWQGLSSCQGMQSFQGPSGPSGAPGAATGD